MRSVLSLTLFIKTLKSANAVFLELLILFVIPKLVSMELRHLRYFAAVAAHGSFSRAAKQLHLTQPALSRQVKSLEDEIGVALIVRGQNTISLSSAGEDFYEEAKDILARVDVAVRRIKTRPQGEKLRIGYVHSLTAGIMPRVVERFQSYNKDVFLELGSRVVAAAAGVLLFHAKDRVAVAAEMRWPPPTTQRPGRKGM